MNGVLLLDKPAGITSHDAVSQIKRLAGVKVGHAGTLDPFATGLLIVLLGEATKISRFLINQDKRYEAKAVIGITTDTLDPTGAVTFETDASSLTEADVKKAFSRFSGVIKQTPPAYSAVKSGGEKAYEAARKGRELALSSRTVEVKELTLTGFKPGSHPEAAFAAKVSKGTYVRSLAADIGKYLGYGAYLSCLRRTGSGRFSINDRSSLEELDSIKSLEKRLISIGEVLEFRQVTVKPEALKAMENGAALQTDYILKGKMPKNETVKISGSNGRILGVQRAENGKMTNLAVFNAGD